MVRRRTGHGDRRGGPQELHKLATYLGAQNSQRFHRRKHLTANAYTWRWRLVALAVTILLLGLWGAWLETGM